MTHQDLIDQVSDELRNKTINTRITRWLNMALTDISSKYVFSFLHITGVADISANANYASLSTPAVIWFKTMGIPSLRRKLTGIDEELLASDVPDYLTRTGVTDRYYYPGPLGPASIGLYLVPTQTIAGGIAYTGQRRPRVLTTDDVGLVTLPELPEEWHPLIAQKALTYGYRYEGNSADADRSVIEEQRIIKSLGALVYQRLDTSTVIGKNTGVRRIRPGYRNTVYPEVRY